MNIVEGSIIEKKLSDLKRERF